MINKFNILFLTLFKIGKIKYAPGTFASIITCLLYLILTNFFNIVIIFYFTIIILIYSILAINNSFDSFEANDPQEIVIDEVVGQMLPLLAIPIYETLYYAPNYFYIILSFVLFRLFDIWKPFPIGYIDKNLSGSQGIMFDDILAGFYCILFSYLIFLLT